VHMSSRRPDGSRRKCLLWNHFWHSVHRCCSSSCRWAVSLAVGTVRLVLARTSLLTVAVPRRSCGSGSEVQEEAEHQLHIQGMLTASARKA